MSEDLLSIGDVARRVGLRTSALRFYEEAGLLRPAVRVSGRRRYDSQVFTRLAAVLLLREAGFSIKEMRALFRGSRAPKVWRALAERKLHEIDAKIDEARRTRRLIERALACECESLEGCDTVQARLGAHARELRNASGSD
jgi:DNA-binding transcriptional MerR regulator